MQLQMTSIVNLCFFCSASIYFLNSVRKKWCVQPHTLFYLSLSFLVIGHLTAIEPSAHRSCRDLRRPPAHTTSPLQWQLTSQTPLFLPISPVVDSSEDGEPRTLLSLPVFNKNTGGICFEILSGKALYT